MNQETLNYNKRSSAFLVCPKCKQKLFENNKSYNCKHCLLSFAKNREFIDFYFKNRNDNPQLNYSSVKIKSSKYSRYFSKFSRSYTSTLPELWHQLLGNKFVCLDIGAALIEDGEIKAHMQSFKRYCYLYFGIDPSKEELRRNIMNDDIILLRGVGEYLPLENNSFELVVVNHTLDHCFDYEMTLSEIYRVLKKDGIVSVFVNNDKSWIKRILNKQAEKKRREAASNHNYYFNPTSLSKDLETIGLKVIYIKGFRYLIFPEAILKTLSHVIGRGMMSLLKLGDYFGNRINYKLGGDFILIARK